MEAIYTFSAHILLKSEIFFTWLSIKLCPPKPGLTDIIRTRSTTVHMQKRDYHVKFLLLKWIQISVLDGLWWCCEGPLVDPPLESGIILWQKENKLEKEIENKNAPSSTYSIVLSGVAGFRTTPALAPRSFIYTVREVLRKIRRKLTALK